MTPPEYRIVWNGEEYVASCPTILDLAGQTVTGHSRHPGWAFSALLSKLRELGVEFVPDPRTRKLVKP